MSAAPEAETISIHELRSKLVEHLKILIKKQKTSISPGERLAVRHHNLIKNESLETRELYDVALIVTGKDEFSRFISDPGQKDPLGRAIAEHNMKVECAFAAAGVRMDSWLGYKKFAREVLVEYDRNKVDELWNEFRLLLPNCLACYEGTLLFHSMRKDLARLLQRKKEIQDGRLKICEKNSDIFPTYEKTFAHLKKKGLEMGKCKADPEPLRAHFYGILKAFSGQEAKKIYTVRLWKREPMRDIFQGNLSGCCLSIGDRNCFPDPKLRLPDVDYRKYPAGITEFLIDKGIQVAEIKETRWGTMGQCWLFLTRDELNRPCLVVDSIELRRERTLTRKRKRAIWNCVVRFLKGYAKTLGIQRIFLGRVGPVVQPDGTRREIRNDVGTDDLLIERLNFQIEKIGGYFRDRPYFLESRHGNSAFVIHEEPKAHR